MECQKVLESLSAFIDGEMDNSEVGSVKQHLEYCDACREQWQLLLDVTSLLHSLPEVMPHPEFRSNLRSELTRLSSVALQGSVLPDLNKEQHNKIPEYEQNNLKVLPKNKLVQFPDQPEVKNYIKNMPTEKVSPAVSLWRNLTGRPWSKLTAYAAVLALAFGITALWYASDLGLKNEPATQIYNMSDRNSVGNKMSKDGSAVPDNHVSSDSDIVNSTDKKENEAQTSKTVKEASTDKTQVNAVDVPLKRSTRQISQEVLPESSQENDNTVEDVNTGESGESNKTLPSTDMSDLTDGQRQDLAATPALPLLQDDKQSLSNSFSVKAGANPNNDKPEAATEKISTEKPSMVTQMNVENNINTIAEILILSKNKNATAKVESNKISIVVPAENYGDLVKQIESIGEASNQKATTGDAAQTPESKSLLVQIEEQKVGN